MKKGIALLLALCFLLGMTACGKQNLETASPDSVEEYPGKTLVAYFSATGHTEKVAKTIADTTGGDLFALQPEQPYTEADLDYNNPDSRVSKEHENPEAREVTLVSATPENWDAYSVVFLGFPIWWGSAAWPVDEFLKKNDFTGKTVIPFATSGSSEMGDSVSALEKLAGTGNWEDGRRFASDVNPETVTAWVNSLGV